MMDDDDIFHEIELGCTECSTVFSADELLEGGCPVCGSRDFNTFEELLAYVVEHKAFLEALGLGDEE